MRRVTRSRKKAVQQQRVVIGKSLRIAKQQTTVVVNRDKLKVGYWQDTLCSLVRYLLKTCLKEEDPLVLFVSLSLLFSPDVALMCHSCITPLIPLWLFSRHYWEGW